MQTHIVLMYVRTYLCECYECMEEISCNRLQTFPIPTCEWSHYIKAHLHSKHAKLGTRISLCRTRASVRTQPQAPGLDMLFFSPRTNTKLCTTKYSQYTRDFVLVCFFLFSSSPVTQLKLRNQMNAIERSFPAY